MRTLAFALALVVLVGGALAAQPGSKTPDEFDQKQKALRDEIEQLQKKLEALKQQQKALNESKQAREAQLEAQRKERERQAKLEAEKKAKLEAEKKKHFAKVEVRGLIMKGVSGQWQVTINELTWTLDLAGKKELEAAARDLAGKGVIVKGTVVNKRLVFPGYPNPGINPGWPNTYPGWPNPNPGFPGDRWNPYLYPFEAPVIITVESIAAAKD